MALPCSSNLRTLALAATVFSGVLSQGCKSAPKVFPDREAGPIAPAATRVVFRPPAGEPIVEKSVTRRGERQGQVRNEEIVAATLETRFDRTERGWTMTQAVSSVEYRRNGTSIDNPLVQFMTRFPIRALLAEDGTFVRLDNPEQIQTAIAQTFTDPNERAVMQDYFSPEAVEAQVKREWEGKYGGLLGREVAAGYALYQVESLATLDSEVFYVTERKVEGTRVAADGRRELVLSVSCPLRLEEAANGEAMRRALEEAGAPALNASVRCEGEQVIGLEPFAPRSMAQQVLAKVDGQDGPLELVLVKETRTESAGGAATAAGQEAR